ncbi:hypothetical protein OG978_01025 [Streptomyces sp. NBC_01591]|uniref:hypothetical protein n=1 Tax=Streptomyces sp. NBC_01591 TaxID=2975888 RepID=UPI002DD81BEB|nr:hypothetical protein [Streptomyces sp. NBC_01591]WSD66148.1 hypothetical protein OG978_01025 [Streptomyces sp. NBC_01591]
MVALIVLVDEHGNDFDRSRVFQLALLETAYGTVLTPTALTRANMELLRQEIIQVDELITKCETDLGSLTDSDRATVESWIHSRDRFVTVIPAEAALAGRALRVSAVEAKHTWA